jgi:hypothetical protein
VINGATFGVRAVDIVWELLTPTITSGTGAALRHNKSSHESIKSLKSVSKLSLKPWT